ncbi:WD repeat domain phosphoinositide-interacting protein 3 [Lepeophtheirus salmonis]|nr:WD repeat domain phosphoinositide-interacting protein 3-like [Lepeophtheirus salmonis]XP_040570153.1 WD repeat domain phosphoinositide-interacting protein 3-like [Lepeophtheirus salmonis]XP_040570154.1 WD repeat domain phosphoinositide-interacting protein 3-like [Lepeophtheirus salmonis]
MSRKSVLFSGFNQDNHCFIVGTCKGFRIFNSDPLREISSWEDEEKGGVTTAEMLFRTDFIALVYESHPQEVLIWDNFNKKSVITIELPTEIKTVRLKRDRILIGLASMVKVYTFTSNPQLLHSFETTHNPLGICCLSPSSSNSYLAFGYKKGFVRIIDLSNTDRSPLDIQAHETCITYITLNVQGTKLATASDKGTLIRIFSTSDGALLSELRRGSQPASINSINFNSDSSLICATSSHGTIHLFAVDDSTMNRHCSLASSKSFVPKYFNSEWSFCRIDVPGGSPCICAFGADKDSIIAICMDGSYHKFKFQKGSYSKEVYHMFLDSCDI